jgi:hypothetical protein
MLADLSYQCISSSILNHKTTRCLPILTNDRELNSHSINHRTTVTIIVVVWKFLPVQPEISRCSINNRQDQNRPLTPSEWQTWNVSMIRHLALLDHLPFSREWPPKLLHRPSSYKPIRLLLVCFLLPNVLAPNQPIQRCMHSRFLMNGRNIGHIVM